MDGWEFAAELQRRQISLPILVMTAAGHAQRGAQQLGADGYLDKPFKLQALLNAVEPLCQAEAA
jgi:CheY-like chemotaxis protein